LTSIIDTRLLIVMNFPANPQEARKTRDFFEKELRNNLIAPTVVVTEFIEIAGATIGEEAAKTKIRLLKEHGVKIVDFKEQHASITGGLLLRNRNMPLADAIIASYVKNGEADYVLTDDPHYKTLGTKTKWPQP
jgi:predicted nucleic acid-binding protein